MDIRYALLSSGICEKSMYSTNKKFNNRLFRLFLVLEWNVSRFSFLWHHSVAKDVEGKCCIFPRAIWSRQPPHGHRTAWTKQRIANMSRDTKLNDICMYVHVDVHNGRMTLVQWRIVEGGMDANTRHNSYLLYAS